MRVEPDHGPSSGGTVLRVLGTEFYIGALEWWGIIGDGPPMHPVWESMGEDGLLPCSLTFITPPMEPGTYPVSVSYGGGPPPGSPFPDGSAGTFTYEASDAQVGRGSCKSAYQCEPPLERCDAGTGRCVPAMCTSLACRPCDDIEGCREESHECESAADCRLIRSSCGCQAVHVSDPREKIESCVLGGCETCAENHCDREHIVPVCLHGQCAELRGDPTGLACEALGAERLAGIIQPPGAVRQLEAVAYQGGFAAAWTEPIGSPSFRNGVIRALVADPNGASAEGAVLLDGPDGRDTNPAIASTGDGLVVVWVTERPRPELYAQRLSREGAALGAPVRVSERADEWVAPLVLGSPDGPLAAWVTDDGAEVGLHHALLGPDLLPVGAPALLPWILPSLEDMDAIRHQGRTVVAWPSSLRTLEGLYWAELPPGDTPVHLLAEEGYEIDLAGWGSGFAAVWRLSIQGTWKGRAGVHLQTFDQGGRALSAPQGIDYHTPTLAGPQVAYLGGVLVVTWIEQDDHDASSPRRLMAIQLHDTGRRLGQAQEVLTLPGPSPALRHVRAGDHILSVYVEPGGAKDTLKLLRWGCAQP